MDKKSKNIVFRRLVRSYLSSVITISLVLLLVGIFGILAINTKILSKYLVENIKITSVLNENLDEYEAKQFKKELDKYPFVAESDYISKQQGTEDLKKMLGADFLEIFESSPVPISIDIKIKSEYFSPDSLKIIKQKILKNDLVEDVIYEEPLVEILHNNLKRFGIIFLVFIGFLMFISIILINNTIRLNVYSKRFSIYTMRLVGATKAFIRAPFVIKSIFQGLFAGLLAVLWLLMILYAVRNEFASIFDIVNVKLLSLVIVGIIVLGVLICLTCTFFVINRLISLNKDDLYY